MMSITIHVCWDTTTWRLVNTYRPSGGDYCRHFQSRGEVTRVKICPGVPEL